MSISISASAALPSSPVLCRRNYDYQIDAVYRSGVDDCAVAWNYRGDCGDFRSTVDFTVRRRRQPMSGETDSAAAQDTGEPATAADIYGIIVQRVRKRTRLTPYAADGGGALVETPLNTSEAIAAFTGGHVKWSNDSYLEYFEVARGESAHGDQFGNGPVCEYDANGPIVDDELDATCGEIRQNGQCIFISSDDPEFSRIVAADYGWIQTHAQTDGHPANGLPAMPDGPRAVAAWRELRSIRSSHMVTHSVRHDWRYLNKCENVRSVAYVDTCVDHGAPE